MRSREPHRLIDSDACHIPNFSASPGHVANHFIRLGMFDMFDVLTDNSRQPACHDLVTDDIIFTNQPRHRRRFESSDRAQAAHHRTATHHGQQSQAHIKHQTQHTPVAAMPAHQTAQSRRLPARKELSKVLLHSNERCSPSAQEGPRVAPKIEKQALYTNGPGKIKATGHLIQSQPLSTLAGDVTCNSSTSRFQRVFAR